MCAAGVAKRAADLEALLIPVSLVSNVSKALDCVSLSESSKLHQCRLNTSYRETHTVIACQKFESSKALGIDSLFGVSVRPTVLMSGASMGLRAYVFALRFLRTKRLRRLIARCFAGPWIEIIREASNFSSRRAVAGRRRMEKLKRWRSRRGRGRRVHWFPRHTLCEICESFTHVWAGQIVAVRSVFSLFLWHRNPPYRHRRKPYLNRHRKFRINFLKCTCPS